MPNLAWNISVANMVDIAVACFIDFATASSSLAATDIDCCCRHRHAAEENKSAWELIETNLQALFSHAFKFLTGTEHLPLLDNSNREASASNSGIFSVGKY